MKTTTRAPVGASRERPETKAQCRGAHPDVEAAPRGERAGRVDGRCAKLGALALVLAPLLCLSQGTAQAQGSKPKVVAETAKEVKEKRATALFVKGSDLYKSKKFALALEQFRQSYALVPSPNSHLYIARCLAALGDSREAYLEFDKVFAEADARAKSEDKYGPTRDSARVERDELLTKLALVTVTVVHPGPTTTIYVGTAVVPREYWGKPYPVQPGAIEAKLSAGEQPITSQALTLTAGQSLRVTLDATAPVAKRDSATEEGTGPVASASSTSATPQEESSSSPLRPLAFVAGGIGVVGFGVFAVAGLMSKATYDSLKDPCSDGPCPPSRMDDISAGKTQQTVANIGLVVGIIGIASGTTLFLLSLSNPKNAPSKPTSHLLFGPGYAGITGRF